MRLFGLIGKKLTHSFSRSFFSEKFEQESIDDCGYRLFELENIKEFPGLWEQYPELVGLNVTIPYKQEVKAYLSRIDESAVQVGAVNVVKRESGGLVGYNSDYWGFKESLTRFLAGAKCGKALVLGTGGSSKAVEAALRDLSIEYQIVSRSPTDSQLSYEAIQQEPQLLVKTDLIVNTTPVGMYPNVEACVALPFEYAQKQQYYFDLVYNPAQTSFMKAALASGAKVKNGLEMLHLQAERSWEIWNQPE